MKLQYTLLAGLAMAFVVGCGNTAEGMKQDAEVNGEKASQATRDAQKNADEAGKDLGAATMLTPKIKTAITADSRLNDPKNVVDVNSTNEKVTLEGHVMSEELKTLAGDITAKVLKENSASQSVVNNLTIQK